MRSRSIHLSSKVVIWDVILHAHHDNALISFFCFSWSRLWCAFRLNRHARSRCMSMSNMFFSQNSYHNSIRPYVNRLNSVSAFTTNVRSMELLSVCICTRNQLKHPSLLVAFWLHCARVSALLSHGNYTIRIKNAITPIISAYKLIDPWNVCRSVFRAQTTCILTECHSVLIHVAP